MTSSTKIWIACTVSGALAGSAVGLTTAMAVKEHHKGVSPSGGAILGIIVGGLAALLPGYIFGKVWGSTEEALGLVAIDRNPTTFRYLK
jgi:hypothetical protein